MADKNTTNLQALTLQQDLVEAKLDDKILKNLSVQPAFTNSAIQGSELWTDSSRLSDVINYNVNIQVNYKPSVIERLSLITDYLSGNAITEDYQVEQTNFSVDQKKSTQPQTLDTFKLNSVMGGNINGVVENLTNAHTLSVMKDRADNHYDTLAVAARTHYQIDPINQYVLFETGPVSGLDGVSAEAVVANAIATLQGVGLADNKNSSYNGTGGSGTPSADLFHQGISKLSMYLEMTTNFGEVFRNYIVNNEAAADLFKQGLSNWTNEYNGVKLFVNDYINGSGQGSPINFIVGVGGAVRSPLTAMRTWVEPSRANFSGLDVSMEYAFGSMPVQPNLVILGVESIDDFLSGGTPLSINTHSIESVVKSKGEKIKHMRVLLKVSDQVKKEKSADLEKKLNSINKQVEEAKKESK